MDASGEAWYTERKEVGGRNEYERFGADRSGDGGKGAAALRAHGGDISIDHVAGKTICVKCWATVPDALGGPDQRDHRGEAELKAALPDLVEKAVVVQTVSDELWEQEKCWRGSTTCKRAKSIEKRPVCTGRRGVYFRIYSRVTTGMTMGLRLVFLNR